MGSQVSNVQSYIIPTVTVQSTIRDYGNMLCVCMYVRMRVCACVHACMHACVRACVRVCVCMCENRIEEVCRICDQLRYESIPAGATHTRGHRFLTSPFDISLALLSFAHPLLVIMGGICYSEIMMND